MIFTFLKQSYSRCNKKWTDFGCILKTEPTGATHALNLVIKKGNQGYFQKFWLNNLKNKISIKRDRKDYKNRFVYGGDCGWGWEEGGAQSWSC